MEAWIALAVSFCALIVSLWGTVFIARWNKRTETFKVFDDLYIKLTSPEVPDELKLVGFTLIDPSQINEYMANNKQSVYQVLNVLETMSLKILKGYIEENIIKRFYRHLVVDAYDRLSPLINYIKVNNPKMCDVYEHYEAIYNKWK